MTPLTYYQVVSDQGFANNTPPTPPRVRYLTNDPPGQRLLFRTRSISNRFCLKSCSVKLYVPHILSNSRLTKPINLSKQPPRHGAWGGMNFHKIALLLSSFFTLSSFANLSNNFAAFVKFVPLSEYRKVGCALLQDNSHNASKKVIADKSLSGTK